MFGVEMYLIITNLSLKSFTGGETIQVSVKDTLRHKVYDILARRFGRTISVLGPFATAEVRGVSD